MHNPSPRWPGLPRAPALRPGRWQRRRGPPRAAPAERKATWSVHEVAVAKARDVYSLQEEHHAGQVGLLHLRRLEWPHVLGGKLLGVQTEELS